MTQYDPGLFEPTDSGVQLATDLNGLVGSLHTNHKGPTRPAYVRPGMLWLDDAGTAWLLKLFDGEDDAVLATIDPATHAVTSTGVPATRKVKTGAAFLLNGVAGTDAAPAEADLSADLLIKLIFASTAASIEGTREDLPVHPAGMKGAIDEALAGFSAGGIKGLKVFTESQTYNPTPGATKALVIATGGGGSGAGGTTARGGGGGGAGATVIGFLDAVTASVVIGAGGAGVGANANGKAGGSTTIGELTAGGGGGGATAGGGGAGGVGSGGALNIRGGVGSSGWTSTPYIPGIGGGSFWGGGGPGFGSSMASPEVFGAGSGGTNVGNIGTFAGVSGVVLVLEF